ncbi:MAG: hypothetical protein AAF799_40355 [Myxococcota bacterium]
MSPKSHLQNLPALCTGLLFPLALGCSAAPSPADDSAESETDAMSDDADVGSDDGDLDPAASTALPQLEDEPTPSDDYSTAGAQVSAHWLEPSVAGDVQDLVLEGTIGNRVEHPIELEVVAIATLEHEEEVVEEYPLFSGTLEPGDKLPVEVAVEMLPLDGPERPTDLVIAVRVPYDNDFVQEIRSPRRHVFLDPEGETVTVKEPARPSSVEESLQLASAWVDIESDPQQSARQPGFAPGAPTPASAAPIDGLHTHDSVNGPLDLPPSMVTTKLCTSWRVHYIDAEPRQAYLGEEGIQEVTASFAKITITTPFDVFDPHASMDLIYEGYLDADGCTPEFEALTGNYVFSLHSRLRSGENDYDIQYHRDDDVDDWGYANGNFRVTGAGTIHRRSVEDNRTTRIAAILSRALVTPGLTIAGSGTLDVYADEGCPTPWIDEDGYSIYAAACGSRLELHVGTNNEGIDLTTMRHVVAHEFGHFVQSRGRRRLGLRDYHDPPYTPDNVMCRCDHVDSANALHCMQSTEKITNAFREGFAHFVAAKIFNDPATPQCRFVYYKEYRLGPEVEHIVEPPVALPCGTFAYTDLYSCDTANAGSQYDWLGYLFEVTRGPDSVDVGDLWPIFADVTALRVGDDIDGLQQFTWPEFVTAVQDSALLTDGQKNTLIERGAIHGVDN